MLAESPLSRDSVATPKKIVLTGGPCAGKTTALARIVEHFSDLGFAVYTVPEAPTLFTNAGVNFLTSNQGLFYHSELKLMQFQLMMEDSICSIASRCGQPALVVCDRGAMDLRAYMTREMWQRILDGLGTAPVELRDARYDAVVHMATAAKGAEKYYTLANNAARSESPELARAIDDRLIMAWTGHPHLRVVGNDCTFDEKMNRVLKEIAHVLGVPQPIEVERKYLVELLEPIPNGNLSDIWQTYLTPLDGLERRIRKRGEDGHYVYFLTTKIRLGPDRSYEHERQITESAYIELLTQANPLKQTIHKQRCCFVWDDQYFELDTFITPDIGIRLLEIEDAESPDDVRIPPFINVLEDVTGNRNYSNSHIALIKNP